MRGPDDLVAGALLRVHLELREPGLVAAGTIAVRTTVATVLPRGG